MACGGGAEKMSWRGVSAAAGRLKKIAA